MSLIACNALSRLTRVSVSKSSQRYFSFEFNDSQKLLQQTAMQFAKQEIIPNEKKYDVSGEFPTDIVQKAFDVGLMNGLISEKYGGVGLSYIDAMITAESLAYGCSGIALAINGTILPATSLLTSGSEELNKKYLGLLASGPNVAALAVTEPHAGSDVGAIKTKAVRDGDDYILNGQKCWITGGGPAKFFVALARTDPDPKTSPGKAFTMFVVDGDAEGLIRGKKEKNMGQRCSDTRTITFENVRVKKENIVGKEGKGFQVCMKTFDGTRPFVASTGVGIAWRAIDEATKWALERKTFGTSIANHQQIQVMLAEMITKLELFRNLNYRAAVAYENKLPNSTYYASIAKLSAADQAQSIVSDAVQIFGGAGFNSEYPVEKLMRDAKILQIYEGTSQIQKLIIFRHMIQNFQKNSTVLLY